MADLSTSILYGDLTVTNDGYVKGQMTIDGGLTVNGNITANNINDSDWDTAYDRSVTGVSGSGDGTLTINRQGVTDVTADLSHTHSEYVSNSGGTIDGGTDTTLTILSNDDGRSMIELYGASQGTGRVFVGQDNTHGGGIEYNGNGSPETTGAGSDYITLWRRDSGVDEWTARNKYNSNDWEFRGNVYASGIFDEENYDLAEFVPLKENEQSFPGYCYHQTGEGLQLTNKRCQKGTIGICSDTYGFGLGARIESNVPIGTSGWVLAKLDKVYEPGTPLTSDEFGKLTEITIEEKRDYPERLIAVMDTEVHEEYLDFGKGPIEVNGRHWVKIR